jgi:hypothetical protein
MSQKSLAQWRNRSRREQFTEACQRLALELQVGTARRHLDAYLLLAETLLAGVTGAEDGFVRDGRAALELLRERVGRRGMGVANDVRIS